MLVALRLIPIGIAALVLVACAKTVKTQLGESTLSNLAGSEWGIQGNDGPFVQFGSGGEINGSGGCNNFFGTYEQNGERLVIGALASTKKACIGPTMDQERDFLKALQNAHHVNATHKALVVYNEHGETLLELIRLDWD